MQGAHSDIEPWFEMPYQQAPIPAAVLQQWASAQPSPELALPPRNPYVATDFALLPNAPPLDTADASFVATAATENVCHSTVLSYSNLPRQ